MRKDIFLDSAPLVELMITQSEKRNSIASQTRPPSDMQLRITLTSCSVSKHRNGKFHSRNKEPDMAIGNYALSAVWKNVLRPEGEDSVFFSGPKIMDDEGAVAWATDLITKDPVKKGHLMEPVLLKITGKIDCSAKNLVKHARAKCGAEAIRNVAGTMYICSGGAGNFHDPCWDGAFEAADDMEAILAALDSRANSLLKASVVKKF